MTRLAPLDICICSPVLNDADVFMDVELLGALLSLACRYGRTFHADDDSREWSAILRQSSEWDGGTQERVV